MMKVKTKNVLSMRAMNAMALTKIFEPHLLTIVDERMLDESIRCWGKKVDLSDIERNELARIILAIVKNEKGNFKEAKESFRRFNLIYKDVYKDGL